MCYSWSPWKWQTKKSKPNRNPYVFAWCAHQSPACRLLPWIASPNSAFSFLFIFPQGLGLSAQVGDKKDLWNGLKFIKFCQGKFCQVPDLQIFSAVSSGLHLSNVWIWSTERQRVSLLKYQDITILVSSRLCAIRQNLPTEPLVCDLWSQAPLQCTPNTSSVKMLEDDYIFFFSPWLKLFN